MLIYYQFPAMTLVQTQLRRIVSKRAIHDISNNLLSKMIQKFYSKLFMQSFL